MRNVPREGDDRSGRTTDTAFMHQAKVVTVLAGAGAAVHLPVRRSSNHESREPMRDVEA
jgi:hypothetical protein